MALAYARVLGSKAQSEKERAAHKGRPQSQVQTGKIAYPAGVVSSTSTAVPSDKVHTLPHQRLSLRRKAAIRRAELIRLSLFIQTHRLATCSRTDWLWILACTLACAEARPKSDRRDWLLAGWSGLDFLTLQDTARKAGLGDSTDAEIERAMNAALKRKAEKGHCFFRPAWLGEKLQLTAAVRDELKIKTIDACDETKEQRLERVHERRREGDKEAKRRKRAAEGRKPRQQYEAGSFSRTKPWEAEGISRPTWERRRARDASMSAHVDRESDTNADTLATTGAEGSAGPCSAPPASLRSAAAQA
jgi:hypothetical protein